MALITGAAHNIGRAITLAYAESGADVVVHAHKSGDAAEALAEEVRSIGRRACVSIADIRDQSAVQRMASAAARELGPIDILVNNAAVRKEEPFESMPLELWREAIGVTLDGAFFCTQAVIRGMLARGTGSIINLVGLTAHTGAAHRAHVITAKSGIIGFTKALAIEYAERGITVNGVSPGTIDTVRGESAGGAMPAHRRTRVVPVGRQGHPDEIAAMCVFLASDQARYITGQIMMVNGGAYV
ncbi:MAG TPA: SDR family oxidoreductase [Chloroflexota bacterium]|nr:SDR family oxidoreductase [Chloroflexota bacterium]